MNYRQKSEKEEERRESGGLKRMHGEFARKKLGLRTKKWQQKKTNTKKVKKKVKSVVEKRAYKTGCFNTSKLCSCQVVSGQKK